MTHGRGPGWFNESGRHAKAAKGIKTGRKSGSHRTARTSMVSQSGHQNKHDIDKETKEIMAIERELDRGPGTGFRAGDTVVCEMCGSEFTVTSRSQVKCPKCGTREEVAGWQRSSHDQANSQQEINKELEAIRTSARKRGHMTDEESYREERLNDELIALKLGKSGPAPARRQVSLSAKKPVSEQDINLMMRRINASPRDEHGNVTDPEAKALISKSWGSEHGYKLTKEQNEKGLSWLRKHKSQMGGREQDVLERTPEIRLIGTYDDHKIIGGHHHSHHYPYYCVYAGKKHPDDLAGRTMHSDNFEYTVIGGKMEIMG